MKKNKGQELYKIAKKNILGRTMLFSKLPEIWLPKHWPSYFSKARKITVWDLEGNRYIDMIFAVGQNILGYSNPKIDQEVIKGIKKNNMTTLNCPEEVILSKKLLSIHPWASKIKFARSGGEANAIAIRIARSATKKQKVAVCGYHGWHDWYLSVNLKNSEELGNHLQPGLNPVGVPKSLKNTVYAFPSNNLRELKRLVTKFDIGIIKMEVARDYLPNKIFLKQVKNFSKKNNLILIFDECTSGFRRNLGGLHLNLGVKPDICIYGKALGNGYAINAVLGNEKVMRNASKSFISSTFWTERIGFVAAINTLKEMQRVNAWKKIIKNGKHLITGLKKLSKKYKLNIEIKGIESIVSFNFKSRYNLEFKTFLTQEMLKNGYLASDKFYLSIYHDKKIINKFLYKLDPIFKKIKELENNGEINNYLEGPVRISDFKRIFN